ncbi:hypothetical protein LSH36_231g02018 [Paralvinella palmiformis]|uniref:ascorbate ferrireductase (transmembrane) n=1 Tax=Paralvinella palmiformis TaxID=53620 RepID=A0AAD9JMH0_9ANNE|nr:hypothetical protein LSH36_231g02018 [Paralvinella palmiformis]
MTHLTSTCTLGPILLLIICNANANLTWHLVDSGTGATPVPIPRRDAALGYDGTLKKLVVFGGRTIRDGATVVLGDTLIYDLSKGVWQTIITDRSPQSRFSMVYGSSGYYFYIAMGQGHNQVFYGDIWRFDMRERRWFKFPVQAKPDYYSDEHWSTLPHVSPESRSGAGGGIFTNSTQFLVSLGSSNRQYGDTYSYDISGMGWYLVSPDKGPYQPMSPHARSQHAATMISPSEILIFGGCLSGGHTGGPCPTGDSWIFDARTMTWKKQSSCASPRTMATLAMLPIVNDQRRVILYGGQERGPGMQVLTGDLPARKSSVSMVTGNIGVYMFGGYDIEREQTTNDLYLLLGDSSSADQTPIISGCSPMFFDLITLHGILMTLAWGVFLPWGAFIARYLKHNGLLRYNLHRLFQIFGLLVGVAGFICGVLSVLNDHFKFVHGIVGLTTTIIGLLQPLNACLRPSVNKTDERKRTGYFAQKLLHAFLGRCGIGLGLANVSLGLFMAQSNKTIWIVWFSYLGFILICYFFAEISQSRSKMADKIDNEQYIVKDIVPASELPRQWFDRFNKCEESL